MARILTGVQSTGTPHLGNLLGAVLPAIEMAKRTEDDSFLFIADLHSLTQIKNGETLRENTFSTAATWLACGLDIEKTHFYKQSDVSEVTELNWYLNCYFPYQRLTLSHSFKDKSEDLKDVNTGLFTYPMLMAADILLYDAELVPVGKDQLQHLEITRDVASRFNHQMGETFIIPKAKLQKERELQKALIKTLKQKQSDLKKRIVKKQNQRKAIDIEIKRLIREAIAASNKALKNNKKNTFNLTPEAKLIATNFRANKGRLPWPLEKGVVIQGFGRQRHPVVKTATIQSNGVIIATEPSAQVRSVFEGEVMSVIIIKGTNPSVLIRHGNFITLYTNLSKLYVRKGEKVSAKQIIGEVFTNEQTGETQLQFGIFNNINALNPKDWVYQM